MAREAAFLCVCGIHIGSVTSAYTPHPHPHPHSYYIRCCSSLSPPPHTHHADEIVNNHKGNRMSSASMPYDDDPSPSPRPSLRHSEVLPPYTPLAPSPVLQLRSHLPSHLASSMTVLPASSRGSAESVPGALRRAQWVRGGGKGSVDSAQLHHQRSPRQGTFNPIVYMSSEAIDKGNSIHLSVPQGAANKGHSRSRSLGNDGLFSISNTNTRADYFYQDSTCEDAPGRMPSLPSPALTRSDDHSLDSGLQRSPPAMVKQASVGGYSLDPRVISTQSSNPTFTLEQTDDDFGESSSLFNFNGHYSDDEVEPGKAQSLPKLAMISVSAEHSSPREPFQRALSEVQCECVHASVHVALLVCPHSYPHGKLLYKTQYGLSMRKHPLLVSQGLGWLHSSSYCL